MIKFMCLLIESIKMQDNQISALSYHQKRMNQARAVLFNCSEPIKLTELKLPRKKGLHKIRIIYGKGIKKIECEVYQKREVKSLRCLHCEDIDYRFKYQNRSQFKKLLLKKGNCDDILIIKKGRLTDTSRSNIAFFDGEKWLTPDSPLLAGTKRQALLDANKLQEAEIRSCDLRHFKKAMMINAFLDFDNPMFIEIQNIQLAD